MAMAFQSGTGSTAPGQVMGDMKTTPLIDVMLVLLIMIIISVPVATHSTTLNLPQPCVTDCELPPADQVKNRLVLDTQDNLLWNGTPVNERQLASLLQETARMKPEPQLQFAPEPSASYNASLRAINQIKASGTSNFGIVGNEQHREFASAE